MSRQLSTLLVVDKGEDHSNNMCQGPARGLACLPVCYDVIHVLRVLHALGAGGYACTNILQKLCLTCEAIGLNSSTALLLQYYEARLNTLGAHVRVFLVGTIATTNTRTAAVLY